MAPRGRLRRVLPPHGALPEDRGLHRLGDRALPGGHTSAPPSRSGWACSTRGLGLGKLEKMAKLAIFCATRRSRKESERPCKAGVRSKLVVSRGRQLGDHGIIITYLILEIHPLHHHNFHHHGSPRSSTRTMATGAASSGRSSSGTSCGCLGIMRAVVMNRKAVCVCVCGG